MTSATPSSASLVPARVPREVDLVVVGSGAGGLCAAVTAASRGLKVAVFEKEPVLGGSTAWSGGWMWIPGSGVQPPGSDSLAQVHGYLERLLRSRYAEQKAKIDAYLDAGPRMVEFLQREFPGIFDFESDATQPDFKARQEDPPGRAIRARSFDGRILGDELRWLRPPLAELTLFGMAIETGEDLNQFFAAGGPWLSSRAWRARWHVASRLLAYGWDLLRHGRDMHLVNGQALVARLLAAALCVESRACGSAGGTSTEQPAADSFRRIGFFPSHAVQRLEWDEDRRACDVVWATPGTESKVRAHHGVVLACGGFPHDLERVAQLVATAPGGSTHWSAAPSGNTGDGLRLGERSGGRVVPLPTPAAWAPVSRWRRRDDAVVVYPHLIERGKPGVIAVDRAGRRFCDEAQSYHDFVADWLLQGPTNGPLQAWLVCDRRFLWRYGLGAVKPLLPPWWAWWTGYLKADWTVDGLARRCGIDPTGLCATLDHYNGAVADGRPDAFGRGGTPFDRFQGDASAGANPCLAPILHPPFFAVRLEPGSLGTFAGLETDVHGRVLDAQNRPLKGLYACGNDMAPVMAGCYPGNGTTVGAAMGFGHAIGEWVVREKGLATP